MNIFEISEKSIRCFDNEQFNIPSYQRPYCWGKREIEQLLNDFQENIDEEIYFIGNIISLKRDENCYDIIDGQQRLTTLWIICKYLSSLNNKVNLSNFCEINNNDSRLKFSIRGKTNEYLQALLIEKKEGCYWNIPKLLPSLDNKVSSPNDIDLIQNKAICEAFTIVKDWFEDEDRSKLLEPLSGFILENLKFEFLVAPQGIDENNLFIQINTNGSQLQHYDILKAELLNKIQDDDERCKYAVLWDKTSYMFAQQDKLADSNESIGEPITLKDLVNNLDSYKERSVDNSDLEEKTSYPFIFNFNIFLLHSLFIFIKNKKNDKISLPYKFISEKLLLIFKDFRQNLTEDMAKEFIDLIVRLKELIIENIIVHDNEKLSLYLSIEDIDNKTNQEMEQLQRMLYHSSNNEYRFYWLGVYLDFLLHKKADNNTLKLSELEKIDNVFSLTDHKFDVYKDYFEKGSLPNLENLEVDNAIEPAWMEFSSIKRYWFYKLEYLLWKENKDVTRMIVSRNSKEHILVQSNRDLYSNKNINIDRFANLVLITVSENSGFSYKNVLEKHEYMKQLGNPPYKMVEFFQELGDHNLIKDEYADSDFLELKRVLEKFEDKMLDLIKNHYNKNQDKKE